MEARIQFSIYLLLFIFLLFLEEPLSAEIVASTHIGYAPVGSLSSDETMPLKAVPLAGQLEYYPFAIDRFNVGALVSAHYVSLDLKRDIQNYNGSYSTLGLGLSFIYKAPNYRVQIAGERLGQASLGIKSITYTKVNDVDFKHAALMQLAGNNGFLLRGALMKTGTLGKNQQVLIGVSLETLVQPFTKETVSVRSNDRTVSPSVTFERESPSRFSYLSLGLLLSYLVP